MFELCADILRKDRRTGFIMMMKSFLDCAKWAFPLERMRTMPTMAAGRDIDSWKTNFDFAVQDFATKLGISAAKWI